MKLLFENWRQYLLMERYSIDSSLETIKPTNKKMYKALKRYINQEWHEGVQRGWIDPKWEPEPAAPQHEIDNAAVKYRSHIFELIPEDIWGPNVQTQEQKKKEADKNQGLAIMWIRKLSLENPQIFADVIDGKVSSLSGPYAGVMPDLEIYFQNLDLMPKRNLIELESFEELHQMVEAAREEIEASRQSKFANINVIDDGTTFLSGGWNKEIPPEDEVNKMSPKEQRELLKDLKTVPGKSGVVIMIINNKAASCFHGTADWCTAQPSLDYFEEYYEPDDPLFIFDRGGEKYQFHYGSEQFMDAGDNRVSDELFKKLHGLLMQTEVPQKYPAIQYFHYGLVVKDRDTSPEELDKIVDTILSGELAGAHSESMSPWLTKGYIQEILTDVAKNQRTPLETLRKLSKLSDKFIIRTVQTNPQLWQEWIDASPDSGEEAMKLAKEIFLNNIKDPLIFDRGLKQIGPWIKAGIMSKEEANKALEDHMEAEKRRKDQQARHGFLRPLQENKIRIKVKKRR